MGLFNSISFKITPNQQDTSSILTINYNGVNLGKEYSVSVDILNKNYSNVYGKRSIVFKKDTIWVHLRDKSTGSNDTWVKISKKDLLEKFGIAEKDVEKLQKGSELQTLIKAKVREKLIKKEKTSSLSGADNLFNSLLKSIYSYFVLYPEAKQLVKNEIAKMDSSTREELFVKGSDKLLSQFKKQLNASSPGTSDFFTDETISRIIDDVLISEVNQDKAKEKKPKWDKTKLQELNTLRFFYFLQNNPNEVTSQYKELAKIDPLRVPFGELASIPINDSNREALVKLWKGHLKEMREKGKLNYLTSDKSDKDILVKISYASQFVEAHSKIPKEIKQLSHQFLDEAYLKDISDFEIMHSLNIRGSSAKTDLTELQKEYEIYQNKIHPHIVNIEKHISFPNWEFFIYGYLSNFEYDDIREQLNELIGTIDLTEEEKEHFPPQRIKNLITRQMERIAIEKYSLTTSQLNNIQKEKNLLDQNKIKVKELISEIQKVQTVEELMELVPLDQVDKYKPYFIFPSNRPVLIGSNLIGQTESLLASLKILTVLKNKIYCMEKDKKGETYLESLLKEIRINENLKTYIDTQNFHNIFSTNSSDPYIIDLLSSNQIKEEIYNGEHAPFLTPELHLALLNINAVNNRNKLGLLKMGDREKTEFYQLCEKIRQDKKLLETLRLFNKKEPAIFEEALEGAPEFLKNFVEGILSVVSPQKEQLVLPAGINQDSIDFILNYTDKKQKIENLLSNLLTIQDKVDHLLEKFNNDPDSIQEEEKLTLKEVGMLMIDSLNKARPGQGNIWTFEKELRGLGFFDLDPQLQKYKKYLDSNPLNQITSLISTQINEFYKPGDLFAYNSSKMAQFKNKPLNQAQKLAGFVTGGSLHGGKLYRNSAGEIQTSEIFTDLETHRFGLYQISISDIWRLHLEPLVPKSQIKHLASLGVKINWDDINEKYTLAENNLLTSFQKESKFKSVKNNPSRQLHAGLADFPFLAKLLGFKGHEREYEKDFRLLRDKLYSDQPLEEGNMICSEFVGKTTLATLITINEKLSADLMNHLGDKFKNASILKKLEAKKIPISDDLKDYVNGKRWYGEESAKTKKLEAEWRQLLKREGYSQEDIDLVIRLNNGELLDLPYSKKERMKAIHPGRMVQLLQDKNCVTKVGLPPIATKLFNFEN